MKKKFKTLWHSSTEVAPSALLNIMLSSPDAMKLE